MKKVELTEYEFSLLVALTIAQVATAVDKIFWELYVKEIRNIEKEIKNVKAEETLSLLREAVNLLNRIDDTIYQCGLDAQNLSYEILDKKDIKKQDISEERINHIMGLLNNEFKELLKSCLKCSHHCYELKNAKNLLKEFHNGSGSYLDVVLKFRLEK